MSRAKKPAPTYEIRTLEDFKLVPAKRLGACLKEFRLAVDLHRAMSELVNAVGAEQSPNEWPADGVKFVPLVFRWTDDRLGKMEFRIKGLGSSADLAPEARGEQEPTSEGET